MIKVIIVMLLMVSPSYSADLSYLHEQQRQGEAIYARNQADNAQWVYREEQEQNRAQASADASSISHSIEQADTDAYSNDEE